jgi:hypothetical protein
MTVAVFLLRFNGALNPVGKVGHLGIDAVLALPTAALAKGGDTVDSPPIVLLT